MRNFNFSLTLIIISIILLSNLNSSFGQSVAINGNGNPADPQAILDVSSDTKGVLLPRVTNHTSIAPTNGSDYGMMVYDTSTDSYWYWDGTNWQEIPNIGSIPAVSLDDAYDGGIVINADAGAVDIQGVGGLTVAGQTAINTTPQSDFKLSVLANSGTQGIYVTASGASSTKYGIHSYTANSRALPIFGEQASTSTAQSYYAVRGRTVTPNETNGYLGYHTLGNNSYAVYGAGGTYAGYFDGNVNLTGELQLNGSAGTSGQVLVSQGSGVDPIWGAAGVQSVNAGDALVNSGNATAIDLDVAANNGLNVDVALDRVQLGGPLTEATTITQNAFDLVFNLNSTGDFIVQDGGVNHFEINDNDGNSFFGGDVTFGDQSTSGTVLVDISDAGTGGNDGRIQVYNDGSVNHTIHGDGDVVFNEVGNDRNFKVESSNDPNMFFLDAGLDRIGIGIGAPTQTLDVDGTIRMRGGTTTAGFVPVSSGDGTMVWTDPTSISTADVTLDEAYDGNGPGFGRTINATDGAVNIAGNDGLLVNGNVGIGVTSAARKLHVQVNESSGQSFPLLVRNLGAQNAGQTGVGIGFNMDNGSNNVRNGIYYERTSDFSRGKLHFLLRNTGDVTPVDLSTDSRLTILSAGNVGIGDVTPDAKLDVDAASGNLMILAQNGTERMRVDASGNAWITGKFNSNGIEELSDARYKKNIEKLNGTLENVLKIQGVTYNWRQDEFPERSFGSQTEIGFIAQDLEKIYPELVNTNDEGYKSVQYSHMVPVLLEAIKEQQHLIDMLMSNLEDFDRDLKASNELKNDASEKIIKLTTQLEDISERLDRVERSSTITSKN